MSGESTVWICPAGQSLCERYSRCRYGRASTDVPAQDRWDCPGPITTRADDGVSTHRVVAALNAAERKP